MGAKLVASARVFDVYRGEQLPPGKKITYSLRNLTAHFSAEKIEPQADGISFEVRERSSGALAQVHLKVPGRHNVQNALAALGAVRAVGVTLEAAVQALGEFSGIRRRLETVGTANGVTVIDDFAHNPDKITATLETLHDFPGRLLVMFQPHGFGPLKLMKGAFIECFAGNLGKDDVLIMPDPVYFGGTVDRSVTSKDITEGVAAMGRAAKAFPDRVHCGEEIIRLARPGDRIIVMGARDDTLSQFAAGLLQALSK